MKEKKAINWIKKVCFLIDRDLGIQVNEKKSARWTTYTAFLEAPWDSNSLTISMCPFLAASWSGESFWYPGVFTKALCWSNNSTTFRCPWLQASCWFWKKKRRRVTRKSNTIIKPHFRKINMNLSQQTGSYLNTHTTGHNLLTE